VAGVQTAQAVSAAVDSTSAATAAATSAATVSASTATASAGSSIEALSAATASQQTGLGIVLAKLDYVIMVPLVYAALAFFLVALVLRLVAILRSPGPPFQLAIYPAPRRPFLAALRDAFGMPQVMKRDPVFWCFLVIFHVGFLALILGHLDLFPDLRILPAESKHMLGGGVLGLMVTIPVFYFLGRRFMGETRKISTPGDYFLLLLLLFLFLFGDLMSWGNSWTAKGFVMTKKDFSQYFSSLAHFSFADPRSVLHGSHYHFIVIHVLLAELFLVVLPFTKVMHAFLSLPVLTLRRHVWKKA
jgi:nitrate reductase gamma subunit